jgi:hypothetical protein
MFLCLCLGSALCSSLVSVAALGRDIRAYRFFRTGQWILWSCAAGSMIYGLFSGADKVWILPLFTLGSLSLCEWLGLEKKYLWFGQIGMLLAVMLAWTWSLVY